MAGLLVCAGPSPSCFGGSCNHIAVCEGYDPSLDQVYISEMMGSANDCIVYLRVYRTSELSSSVRWIDISSLGFSSSGGGRGGYFKDKFGEFHWPVKPEKDARFPTSSEYQEFCDRLNEAQEEAGVENPTKFSATQDNNVLTAARFNEYLHLMQESTEGNLRGVDDQVELMEDVKKDDVIYAKHFLQLENLYNHWMYGNFSGNGIVPGDDPNCMVASTVWNSLHCGFGLNEYVTAGILGSAIFETSGPGATLASLDQNWDIWNYLGCYGLWQFCPKGAGIPEDKSVEGQILHLMNGLPGEMDIYGPRLYQPGFGWDEFCQIRNEQTAAYVFRLCYERGDYNNSANEFATMAYNYFSGKRCPSIGTGGGNGDGIATGTMGWPFANGGGTITQPFTWNGFGGHLGVDISTTGGYGAGSPVLAVDGGTVVSAGWGVSHGSYGNEVNISHGNGLYTRYAHLYQINVSVGQNVSKGQTIGIEGNTGSSDGTHLHFEVHAGIPNGQRYNPMNYLHRYG